MPNFWVGDFLHQVFPVPERYFSVLQKARVAAENDFPDFLPEINFHIFRLNYLNSIPDTPFSLGKELVSSESRLEPKRKLEVLNILIEIYKGYGRGQEVIALLKARYNLLQSDSNHVDYLTDHMDLPITMRAILSWPGPITKKRLPTTAKRRPGIMLVLTSTMWG